MIYVGSTLERIDTHVHCRDGKQAYKGTISNTFEIADKAGVKKIIDMPNTDPPIFLSSDVIERLKFVPKDRKENYFLYVGATSDEKQLTEAVSCFDSFNEVVGFKLYAGHSVGNLGVVSVESQKKVWQTLASIGFKGVVVVHCEKESLINSSLWNPDKPITHAHARSKQAEIESVKDQLAIVKQLEFKGTVQFAHISCPESVELIDKARNSQKVSIEVTPHHLLWTDEMLQRPDGLIYKMNPPLRDKQTVEKLRDLLKQGKIDCIGTDHAPHPIHEKLHAPYMSGYPSLALYKELLEKFLPSIGVSQKLIDDMTCWNIKKIFGKKLG